jgi:hypothetical protein
MNLDEIRAKSAELSVMMCAHTTSACIIKHGANTLTEIEPLAMAKEFEAYIRTGIVPKSNKVILNVR